MTYQDASKELIRLSKKELNLGERKQGLKELATKVGASLPREYLKGNEDTISELTAHVNQAIQTLAMVEACKIANRNFQLAIVAIVIAIFGTAAAWATVILYRN